MGLFSTDKPKPYKPKSKPMAHWPELSDKYTAKDKPKPKEPNVSRAFPVYPEQGTVTNNNIRERKG